MKYFSIANELDHNIKVELDTKKFPSELDKSYPKKQIIPPGSTRTFNVILYSKTAHEDFKQMIRYQINGVHNYMFMVKAVVEPVTLDIQPPGTIIDFDFSNTTERVAKRELTLTNNGNADARFAIELDKKDKRAFTVEESSMLIEKGKSKVCIYIYIYIDIYIYIYLETLNQICPKRERRERRGRDQSASAERDRHLSPLYRTCRIV